MIAIRHTETGAVQIVDSLSGVGEGWEELPPPPALDGWRWDNDAEAWVAFGPRVWPLRLFLTVLLTPMEMVSIRTWQPAGAPTPDDLTFIWAREVILTLDTVRLDDPNTTAALAMCEARGLLSEARVARILTGLPPEV
jgi:hypothetical protein